MSWVKERLEELGFKDVAARLNDMTAPYRERPRKLSGAKLRAKKVAEARRERKRLRAGESA